MKTKNFSVDLYKTKIHLIQIEKGDSYEDLPTELLNEIECLQDDDLNTDLPTWFSIDEPVFDAGYTIGEGRDIYIVFSRHTLGIQKVNTYSHEMYHAVRKILEYCEIDDEEAGAYLQGYIAEEFYNFFTD